MKHVLFLLTFLFAVEATAIAETPRSPRAVTEAQAKEAEQLTQRLEQIREIDRSTLSADQKRELRSEVRSIRQQLREIGGGVYISAAALIIIVLLLILLL